MLPVLNDTRTLSLSYDRLKLIIDLNGFLKRCVCRDGFEGLNERSIPGFEGLYIFNMKRVIFESFNEGSE